MWKNLIYSLLKKKWHLILLLFAVIALHYKFNSLEISRKKCRKKCMFFKPSFKCLKIKKINFSPAILKPETLLYQNIYIYIYIISTYIIFAMRFWFKKKSGLREKKTRQITYQIFHVHYFRHKLYNDVATKLLMLVTHHIMHHHLQNATPLTQILGRVVPIANLHHSLLPVNSRAQQHLVRHVQLQHIQVGIHGVEFDG